MLRASRRLELWALTAILPGLLVCQHAEDQPPPARQTAPKLNLSQVVRQVHFAFRGARDGRHVGGHATYGVEVSRRGAVEVRPTHHTATGVLRGAALVLETVSVRRGDQDLTRAEGRGAAPPRAGAERPKIRVLGDGRLSLRRAEVEELLENREAGVEQSFRFDRRPRGEGDLAVRVAVSGAQRYVGQSPGGTHFVDPASGVGLRYGRAYWVERSGRRTEVAVRFEGGALELRVPGALLDRSTYPALLDPVIGPEFGMDQPAHGPPVKAQQVPAIAFDGTNYLVVWQDNREGTTWDVVGTRVSASGVVLDVEGIEISTATKSQQTPAVVYGGGHYLVVWQDSRSGWNIYGARVKASDGAVQETAGLAISTAGGDQTTPAAAFDGTNYFVVWQDKRSGNWDIYGARVTTAGSVMDTSGMMISTAASNQTAPAVAYDGTGYLVVWQDYRSLTDYDIYGARVTTAGGVLDSTGVAIAQVTNNQQEPAIAFDGTNYLVVWQDNRNPGTKWDIFGTRVTPAAAVLDSLGIAVSKYDNDTHDQQWPTLDHDGTNYFVAWHDNRDGTWDIYGARVSNTGAVLDTAGNPFLLINGQAWSQRHPALCYGSSGYLVVWSDFRTEKAGLLSGSDWDIFGTTLTPAGVVGSTAGTALSKDRNAQQTPAVTHDGTNYLVVWSDYRTGANGPGWDIYGVRVSGTGTVLDTSGIAISTAVNDQREPAVAYGGGQSLVVWQDRRAQTTWDIYAARVSAAGTVLDAGGVAISTAAADQQHPSVVHGNGQFLAVWQDSRIGKQWDIYAARVAPAGTVTDATGIAVSSAASHQQRPTVAFDSTDYFVVWQDQRAGTTWDIYGARLSATGSLLDPQGKVVSIVSNHQQAPVVTHDGTNYIVAWQDKRGGTNWDIYAARVDSLGVAKETSGIPVSTATEDQTAPSIGHDGYNTVMVWQDNRAKNNWDVYGARMTSAGVVGDTQGIALTSDANYDETTPAVAGSGDGRVLLVYRRPEDDTIYGTDRVQARIVVTLGPDGSTCSGSVDCKSGHCVDGVCCESACGGGVTTDCQACSVKAGAATDGVCGAASSTTECRPAAGTCDVAELCNGSATTCPADSLEAAGTTCRAVAGNCDVAESCDGTTAICPADVVKPAGTACRVVDGDCDVAESCDGTTAICPTDIFKSSSDVCRPAAGECDAEETCSGVDKSCPADQHQPDGTTCTGGTCKAGACVPVGDAGPLPEAGVDAGADVGPREAGADATPSEAGTGDAAAGDAAAGDAGPDTGVRCFGPTCEEPDDGCGCRVANPPGRPFELPALLLLLVFGFVLRRRAR